MNDRIKLAEAMGIIGSHDAAIMQKRPDKGNLRGVPDPFTDANDDYVVLEWIRSQGILGSKIATQLSQTGYGKWSIDYKIGDYARAALKVLDKGDTK